MKNCCEIKLLGETVEKIEALRRNFIAEQVANKREWCMLSSKFNKEWGDSKREAAYRMSGQLAIAVA
jgi:hypothetical protein